MKKSDIAMIILIAGVSMMAAFAIANNVSILKVSDKGETVSTIEEISPEVVSKPSTTVFNKDAINPTVKTVIGGSGQ
jgi:hypothetical protein